MEKLYKQQQPLVAKQDSVVNLLGSSQILPKLENSGASITKENWKV